MPTSRMKMSDDAYFKWCASLDERAYNRECQKLYRTIEYGVNEINVNGDIIDTSFYDTLLEAKEQFDRTSLEGDIVKVEIEKVINRYRGGDRQLEDRDYEETGIFKEIK